MTHIPRYIQLIHNAFKGHVLMIVGGKRIGFHLRQIIAEGLLRIDGSAQTKRIHKYPNQRLQHLLRSIRYGRAHRKISLSAMAI